MEAAMFTAMARKIWLKHTTTTMNDALKSERMWPHFMAELLRLATGETVEKEYVGTYPRCALAFFTKYYADDDGNGYDEKKPPATLQVDHIAVTNFRKQCSKLLHMPINNCMHCMITQLVPLLSIGQQVSGGGGSNGGARLVS